MQSGKVARSGEEKAGYGASIEAYGRASAKVSEKSIVAEKNSRGMAAMQLLHCTIVTNHLYIRRVEDKLGAWDMGFFTEMFARPRPQEQQRYRSALALLNAMSNADRADIGIKPADFPRIAREMSIR